MVLRCPCLGTNKLAVFFWRVHEREFLMAAFWGSSCPDLNSHFLCRCCCCPLPNQTHFSLSYESRLSALCNSRQIVGRKTSPISSLRGTGINWTPLLSLSLNTHTLDWTEPASDKKCGDGDHQDENKHVCENIRRRKEGRKDTENWGWGNWGGARAQNNNKERDQKERGERN